MLANLSSRLPYESTQPAKIVRSLYNFNSIWFHMQRRSMRVRSKTIDNRVPVCSVCASLLLLTPARFA